MSKQEQIKFLEAFIVLWGIVVDSNGFNELSPELLVTLYKEFRMMNGHAEISAEDLLHDLKAN